MSDFKEQPAEGEQDADELPRKLPKCTRCRYHGVTVLKRGHMRFCPYVNCPCWKCGVVAQRRGSAALQTGGDTVGCGSPLGPDGAAPSQGSQGSPVAALAAAAAARGVSAPSVAFATACPPAPAPANIWKPVKPPSWAFIERGGLDEEIADSSAVVADAYSGELGPMGPLPVIPFPFVDSELIRIGPSSSLRPPPRMQLRPPTPATFIKNGPPSVPPPQQGPVQFFVPAVPQHPPNWMQLVISYPPFPQPGTVQGPLGTPQPLQPATPNNNQGT